MREKEINYREITPEIQYLMIINGFDTYNQIFKKLWRVRDVDCYVSSMVNPKDLVKTGDEHVLLYIHFTKPKTLPKEIFQYNPIFLSCDTSPKELFWFVNAGNRLEIHSKRKKTFNVY